MNPLKFIPVGAVLGDQESAESLALPNIYSSGGSRNVYVDKLGRATSILGYTARTAAPVTSNTGANAMRLIGLYHYGYRNPLGGAVLRIEVGIFDSGPSGINYEFRVSTDGGQTWTFVQDFGSAYVDHVPDFAQLGNLMMLAFGVGSAYAYEAGVSFGVATTAQLAAPTLVAGAVGLLDGTYQFRIVPIKANGTRKAASVASAALSVSKKQIAVTWGADAEAASYEVYRTTGTGKVFFYEGNVATGTLTFTAIASDLQLIAGRALQEYGDPPPTDVAYVESHAERMFYGVTPAFPRRWWYSDPGLPFSVFADANFFDMTDAESFNDVSTGGTGNYKGMFIAWLERSVWTISGKGTFSGVVIDFQRRRTNAQTGTVSHRTVARIPKGSVYLDSAGNAKVTSESLLAYLTPLGDVRLFDGDGDTIISWAKQDVFARMTYRARSKAYAVGDVQHGEVTWVFPADDADQPNLAVSWNLRTGTMTERRWGFAHAIEIESVDDSSFLIAGESTLATGGHCYRLWDGITNNGAHIAPTIMTKTFYGTDRYGTLLTQYTKRWRWADILVHCAGGGLSLLVEWLPGEAGDNDPAYGSVTLLMPAGRTIQSVDLTTIQSSDSVTLTTNVPTAMLRAKIHSTTGRYLHSRGVRLRFSSQSDVQWSIPGFTIAYQVLAGLKRDFRR